MADQNGPKHRPIRSFVRREGRLTPGQERALTELLPRYTVEPGEQPLDMQAIFGNSNPVVMEIGFGNGRLLAQQAQQHPEFNFIGLEVHRPGVGHLLLQLQEHATENVRILNQDAMEVLSRHIPAQSLYALWLYFPDPWPKKKHHKRRIVNQRFLDLVMNSLQDNGVLHMATDWQDYAEHMQAAVTEHGQFSKLDPSALPDDYPFLRPATHFEQRGRRKGHVITDLYFRINDT